MKEQLAHLLDMAARPNISMIRIPQQVHELALLFDQIRGDAFPVSESEKLIRALMEQT
jgi:hypothetical protein